jgi:hypothetical protein
MRRRDAADSVAAQAARFWLFASDLGLGCVVAHGQSAKPARLSASAFAMHPVQLIASLPFPRHPHAMAATEVTFSPERSLEAVLLVASRLAKPAIHEVLKLLYFADKIHLGRYGWLASGDDYVAMRFGPVASGAYNLLKAARGDESGWIHPEFYRLVRGSIEIADDKRSINLLRSVDIGQLSPAYVGCLEEALTSYAGMSFGSRTELSHDDAWRAAWDVAAEDEVGQSPMPVESIAKTLPNAEEVVAQLHQQ